MLQAIYFALHFAMFFLGVVLEISFDFFGWPLPLQLHSHLKMVLYVPL
ncbi:MAG: hypothetical protein CM15mV45_850 [uncultured marine virus]|nr:MAG: hypothetical protein CM15mV45_850 [uncultured marine virus]